MATLKNEVLSELAANGYNKEDFKIEVKKSKSLNNDIYIHIHLIKQVGVKELAKIQSITKRFKKVDFCLNSLEVLNGGNTFVKVYDNRSLFANWEAIAAN